MRTRVRPPHPKPTVEQTEAAAKAQETLDEIDELLGDIDEILEEQQVLLDFRQKGGQ